MMPKPIDSDVAKFVPTEFYRVHVAKLMVMLLEYGEAELIRHGFTDDLLFKMNRLAYAKPLYFTADDIAMLHCVADLLAPEIENSI
jgi:hypothetical protein